MRFSFSFRVSGSSLGIEPTRQLGTETSDKRGHPPCCINGCASSCCLLLFPINSLAQETYLVAYAGFAGFQAPVWAPKDLGLFSKYGFNGDVVLVPGSVRQIQAVLGGSIHLAQIDAATAINAINQGADLVMISGHAQQFSV